MGNKLLRKVSIITSMCLMLAVILYTVCNVTYAAQAEEMTGTSTQSLKQDISIAVDTDKESYEYGDDIELGIRIINSYSDCENVTFTVKVSDGISLVDASRLDYYYDRVDAGSSYSIAKLKGKLIKQHMNGNTDITKDNTDATKVNTDITNGSTEAAAVNTDTAGESTVSPKTYDGGYIVICVMTALAIIAFIIALLCRNKKIISLMLVCILSAGMCTGAVNNTEYVYADSNTVTDNNTTGITYSIVKDIELSGEKETVEVVVSIGQVKEHIKTEPKQAKLVCIDTVASDAEYFTVGVSSKEDAFAQNISVSDVELTGGLKNMQVSEVIRVDANTVLVSARRNSIQDSDAGVGTAAGINFLSEAFADDNVEAAQTAIEIKPSKLDILTDKISESSYSGGVLYVPVSLKHVQVVETQGYAGMFYIEGNKYKVESVTLTDENYVVGIRTDSKDIAEAVKALNGTYLCVDENYVNCKAVKGYISIETDVNVNASYYNHTVKENSDGSVDITILGEIGIEVTNGVIKKTDIKDITLEAEDIGYGTTVINSVEAINDYGTVKIMATTHMDKNQYENVKTMLENNNYGYVLFDYAMPAGSVVSNWGSTAELPEYVCSLSYNQLGAGDDFSVSGIALEIGKKLLGSVADKAYNKLTHTPDMKDLGNGLSDISSQLGQVKSDLGDIKSGLAQSNNMLNEMSRQLKANKYETVMTNFETHNNAIKSRTDVIIRYLTNSISRLELKASEIEIKDNEVVNADKAQEYIGMYSGMLENVLNEIAKDGNSTDYVENVIRFGNVITGDTNGGVYGSKSFIQSFDDYYYGAVSNYNFDMQDTEAVNKVRAYIAATYAKYYTVAKIVLNYNINTCQGDDGIYRSWEEELDNQYGRISSLVNERGSDGRIYCIPLDKYYQKTILVKNFGNIGVEEYDIDVSVNPTMEQLAALAQRSSQRNTTVFKDIIDAGFILGNDYVCKNAPSYNKSMGNIDEFISKYYGDCSGLYITASNGFVHYVMSEYKDGYSNSERYQGKDYNLYHNRYLLYPGISAKGISGTDNNIKDCRLYTTCSKAFYRDEERHDNHIYCHEIDYVRSALDNQNNAYANWLEETCFNGGIGLSQRRDAFGVMRMLESRINARDYWIYDYYYFANGIIIELEARYFYWKDVWEKIDIGKYQRGASPMLFFRAA